MQLKCVTVYVCDQLRSPGTLTRQLGFEIRHRNLDGPVMSPPRREDIEVPDVPGDGYIMIDSVDVRCGNAD